MMVHVYGQGFGRARAPVSSAVLLWSPTDARLWNGMHRREETELLKGLGEEEDTPARSAGIKGHTVKQLEGTRAVDTVRRVRF